MAGPNDMKGGLTNKELHLFFVLDTSGSMKDNRAIEQLGEGMRATLEVLKSKFEKSSDVRLKVAVMEFNTGARWITGGENHLEDIEDFQAIRVEEMGFTAQGMTYMGYALKMLAEGLSRNTMMKSPTGNKCPIIIFLTDGYPTDNWRSALEKIRENKWYQQAIKIGIALGEKADKDVLAQIVGTSEAVVTVEKTNDLAKMIQVLSVTASLSGSVSQTVAPDAGKLVEQARREVSGTFEPDERTAREDQPTRTVDPVDTMDDPLRRPVPEDDEDLDDLDLE